MISDAGVGACASPGIEKNGQSGHLLAGLPSFGRLYGFI